MSDFLPLADLAGMPHEEVVSVLAEAFQADLSGVRLLIAYMSEGSWGCGSSAFVLFDKGGALFEVNGSHCSCYGFEGQWEPESVGDLRAIEIRSDYALAGGGYDNEQSQNACMIRSFVSGLSDE